MDSFDEVRFRSQVDKSLSAARTVLSNEKSPPALAASVPHTWNDKYAQCELLTNTVFFFFFFFFPLFSVVFSRSLSFSCWTFSFAVKFAGPSFVFVVVPFFSFSFFLKYM
jgi:hypothetical protein